jgi:hypothetical protein
MTQKSNAQEILNSVVGETLPQLTKDEQTEIVELLLKYIRSLNEAKIEEAHDLIRANYRILEKIL